MRDLSLPPKHLPILVGQRGSSLLLSSVSHYWLTDKLVPTLFSSSRSNQLMMVPRFIHATFLKLEARSSSVSSGILLCKHHQLILINLPTFFINNIFPDDIHILTRLISLRVYLSVLCFYRHQPRILALPNKPSLPQSWLEQRKNSEPVKQTFGENSRPFIAQ